MQKPLKDICNVCFQFNQMYCQEIEKKRKHQRDRLRNSIVYGSDDEEDTHNDFSAFKDYTAHEAFLKVAQHIEEARFMRDLFVELEAEAKRCTQEGVPAEEMCIVIVVDYFCQNLELPSFQMDQPKETYCVKTCAIPS